MNVGGAERSVLKLLRQFAARGWKVHLVLTTGGGVFETEIPKAVVVTRLRPWASGGKIRGASKLSERIVAIPDLISYCASLCIELFLKVGFLFRSFDSAIVCLGGLSPQFCVRWVRAKKVIHWIRNDITHSDPDDKVGQNIRLYSSKVDYYVCVSKTCRDSLIDKFPDLENKAHVIYNVFYFAGFCHDAMYRGIRNDVFKSELRPRFTVEFRCPFRQLLASDL